MSIIRENFYELLGVESTASPSEVRTAFRKLAQKYHPDTGSLDPEHIELFKRITEAYHVLSDPDRRNDYNKEAGLQFHEEIDLGIPIEPQVAPELDPSGRTRVDIGGSKKDFSHLRASVEEGDLKVGHKIAVMPEEELKALNTPPDAEISAWGEIDPRSQRSGGFSILSGLRKDNASARRAELKRNLKTTLSDDNQPKSPTQEKPKARRPAQIQSQWEESESVEDPFKGERIYHFQITALDAIVGTSRELVLSIGSDDKPHKLEFTIPPGVTDGTLMEVSRGWDRATVKIGVVQDSRFLVSGLDIELRVPVTLKEALDGAQIVVPGVDQVQRVNLRASSLGGESVRVPGAGVRADGMTGDLIVRPFIVPPGQVSETLKAAAKVVDEHCEQNVRKAFLAAPDSAQFRHDESNLIYLFLPVLFSETIVGTTIDVTIDGAKIPVNIGTPWNFNKEIALADPAKLGDRILIVQPIVAPPNRSSDSLQAAALAIEQHYLTPPRSSLPRLLRRSS